VERERLFDMMTEEEEQLKTLPEKYKRLIHHETEFQDLLRKAHDEHDKALQREEQR
jgi:tellurite resistance protein TerC